MDYQSIAGESSEVPTHHDAIPNGGKPQHDSRPIVFVTGGTGHLGRDLLSVLVAQGRRVRALARQPGECPGVEWIHGDLATGKGLGDALIGVDTVIHAATFSPIAKRGGFRPMDFVRSPASVDVDGTRRLLDGSLQNGVRHFIFVSIVGLEGTPLPYAKVKLAGETLVRESKLPWSVVRAAPYYYLVERMLNGMRWLPILPLPNGASQPVDTSDVAEYLVRCLDDGQRGMRKEIGGPEVLSMAEIARQYFTALGSKRLVIPVTVSRTTLLKLGFAAPTADDAMRGAVRWRTWLRNHLDQ